MRKLGGACGVALSLVGSITEGEVMGWCATQGMLNTKVEPTPGWLRTWMSPPSKRANDMEISKPNPAPLNCRDKPASAW